MEVPHHAAPIMFKLRDANPPNARSSSRPGPRGASLSFVPSGMAFALILSGGCDVQTPSGSVDTQNSSFIASVDRAANLNGATVRVAGQARCLGCNMQELESLLRAKPRRPLPKEPLSVPAHLRNQAWPQAQAQVRWSVKFRDDLSVRLSSQSTRSPSFVPPYPNQTPNNAQPQLLSHTGDNLDAVETLRQRYQARFVPEIRMSEQDLNHIRERALRRTLVAQPDLAALYWVDATFESAKDMLAFGEQLQALDVVEFVELEFLNVPPPKDIPPTSSDLSSSQGHLGPNPGVNGTYAWKQGYFGQGIRVSDCEYSWQTKHEDLVDNPIQVEKGQSIGSHEINHGTAVIGIVVAGHNGYGVKGLAPKATPAVYPEGPNRRVEAISSAIRDSSKGDIVMLEMQTYGSSNQRDLVPAEFEKPVWMATKTGTDAGVLVIAAAGNGDQNLDASRYKAYMDRGDSGALIIGAGTANRSHSKMYFSTYGKRVDLQGWGEKVVTTGYGDLKKFGGDKLQMYTRTFAGTSSATPIVSGATALVQSFAKEAHGKVLSPKEMRELLKETGIAQKGGSNIGIFPNVKAAFEKLGKGEKDSTAPKVAITSPKKDVVATLGEDDDFHAVTIEVQATDNTRVKEVQLELNGKKVGDADKEEPYIFEVELREGDYDIVAIATDRSDNEGRSKKLNAKIKPHSEKGDTEDKSDDDDSGDDEAGDDETGDDDSGDDETGDDSEESETEDSGADAAQDPDKTPTPSGKADSDLDVDESEDSDGNADDDTARNKGGCAIQHSSSGTPFFMLGLLALGRLRRRRTSRRCRLHR